MDDAVRLTFEYRDGEFVAQPPQKVRMVAPELPVPKTRGLVAGRFLELRSATGKAVRSVRVGGEEPPTVEFPTGDPDQPFARTEPPPGSVLSVVVEADERATHAALVEVAPSRTRGKTQLTRRDLAIVPLDGEPE